MISNAVYTRQGRELNDIIDRFAKKAGAINCPTLSKLQDSQQHLF